MSEPEYINQKVRETWETNARFWEENMGEGNDFVNELVRPTVERLLLPRKGERLLDIACGNGLTSRRLAGAGADVVAFDFSEEMISIAKEQVEGLIDYRVIDAMDSEALLQLGAESFDGALCNMAFMDMADIKPLMNSLTILLRPGGRFFSLSCTRASTTLPVSRCVNLKTVTEPWLQPTP